MTQVSKRKLTDLTLNPNHKNHNPNWRMLTGSMRGKIQSWRAKMEEETRLELTRLAEVKGVYFVVNLATGRVWGAVLTFFSLH